MKTKIKTKAQLLKELSPKQKVFVDNLINEGATFELVATSGHPRITKIVRKPVHRGWGHEDPHDYDYDGDFYLGIDDFQG